MLKRKIASYIRESYDNSRNALLITGARYGNVLTEKR